MLHSLVAPMAARGVPGLVFGALVSWAALKFASSAHAYPSAVVFAPTAEVNDLGHTVLSGYTSFPLAPDTLPGVTWFGTEIGVLRKKSDAAHGLEFGGAELGVDFYNADLQGTTDSYVKTVFNVKIQALREFRWIPNTALGFMQFAPFHSSRSLNLAYLSLTKTIGVLGKFTIGLGRVNNSFSNDPYHLTAPAFVGAWPFGASSSYSLLAGYQSPTWGPFSVGLDSVGGASEISSVNLAGNFAIQKGVTWASGGWWTLAPDHYESGLYINLVFDFSLFR